MKDSVMNGLGNFDESKFDKSRADPDFNKGGA